jgi:lipopolysaccharide export system permease protein
LKKLHKLIIGSFIGPFIITFAVVLFIFLMQFVWKWVDDFMGKGLAFNVILELLLYASANLVNICLPLAVLLSSIMTFGNLAENFELVALKSAGISLYRIMLPLIVFVIFLTAGAFYFANNISPIATLKFKSLLYDITQAKPSIELRDGIFYNGMEGYSIRVGHNDRETGDLHDMLIYDHSKKQNGNKTVIRAKKGRMEQTDDKRFLILTLFDGYSYDESTSDKKAEMQRPLISNQFEKDVLRIDMSGFLLQRSDEDQWKNHMQMLTMGQLDGAIDSLQSMYDDRKDEYQRYLNRSLFIRKDSLYDQRSENTEPLGYFTSLNYQAKRRAVNLALNVAQNSKNYVSSTKQELTNRTSYINRHFNEWHRKITLSVACLVFFFIGAPLGAIIKKGGIGLPVVVSVLFFLLFHVSSITGEKMAKTGVIDPFTGMWLSTFILLPISIFLSIKGAKDAAIFDPGGWDRLLNKLRRKKKPSDENFTTVS